MKKIAILMNTNQLGGAERSMLLQMKDLNDYQKVFFIPRLKGNDSLSIAIVDENIGSIKYFDYPQNIYQISRTHLFRNIIPTIFEVLSVVFFARQLRDLNKFDFIYLNGNKSAFLFFLSNFHLRYKSNVIWHLRDYYTNTKFNNFIWKSITNISSKQLTIVCNSNSVKESLNKTIWSKFQSTVIYNPAGIEVDKHIGDLKVIGFVSMLAPWKGVHEILVWAKLYEDDLKQLGIRQINVYGDDIYQTGGEHQSYKKQLLELKDKLNIENIKFIGLKKPNEIFQEIDCLIHYSLRPEPFGRVVIEAFEAGIPVISTALGGSSELIENNINAYRVVAYDRRGLFEAVRELVDNKILRFDFINKSKEKSKKIQKDISLKMKQLFIEDKAS